MDLSKIDPNFAEKHLPDGIKLDFYSATDPVFGLSGIYHNGLSYTRMPTDVAKSVSAGVTALHRNTSGGRIRFYTDSPTVTVSAVSDMITGMPHFTHIGANGFDLYLDGKPQGSFYSFWRQEGELYYLSVSKVLAHAGEVEIYFPLYANVIDVKIGLETGSTLEKSSKKYANEKPVVFYGSSVTQGGCATRAGMSYEAILCRKLNLDFINLGFSGNAHGEAEIACYIASLDMSMFVFDYDYNARTAEHLLETHQPFFDIIRSAHPDIPIVLMSAPKFDRSRDFERRIEIIGDTYNTAIARGDNNVYFLTGDDLLGAVGDEGLVDNCHPTDLGFWNMANALLPVVRDALGLLK